MSKGKQVPKISARQLGAFIITNRVSASLVFLTPVGQAGQPSRDTWLSALLSGTGALVFTYGTVSLARKYPSKSMIEICEAILGKWVGFAVSIIVLLSFLKGSIISIRGFSEIINTAIMPETPKQVFMISVTLAAVLCVRRGIEAIARANAIILLLSIVMLFLMVIAVLPQFHINSLLPIVENGWIPIFKNVLVPMAWFAEVSLIPMLFPYVKDQENVMPYVLVAQLINIILLVILCATVTGVFGAEEAQNNTLPVFSMIRMISIAQFFERIEIFLVVIWVGLFVMKASLYLYLTVIGVGQWLKLSTCKFLIIPLAAMTLIFVDQSFIGIEDYMHIFSPHNWGIYGVLMGTFPIALLMFSWFRKGKQVV